MDMTFKRLLLASVSLLACSAAHADEVLQAPHIDASRNLYYPGGPTLGTWIDGVWSPDLNAGAALANLNASPFNDLTTLLGITGGTLNTDYAAVQPSNAIMLSGGGNLVSFCPPLSCVTSPTTDHQRTAAMFQATTADDGHSEEQTLAVITTIQTGFAKTWAPSTAFSVGDNITFSAANTVYRVTVPGISASSGAGPTGKGTDIVDGTVHWSWINDAAIDAKVGIYNETRVLAGGGASWAQANNFHLMPGSTPSFQVNTEFDFSNESADCVIGTSNCNNLYISMGGPFQSTAAISIQDDGTSNYVAHWGIRLAGSHLASDEDIEDDASGSIGLGFGLFTPSTHSQATIKDASTSPIAISLAGINSSSSIQDGTTSPAFIAMSGTHNLAAIFDLSHSQNGIALNGTYAGAQILGTGWLVNPTGGVTATDYVSSTPNGCAQTAGNYDPGGSSGWVPTCSGTWIGNVPNQYVVYPVTGTQGTPPVPNPLTNPHTQVLIQSISQIDDLPENALTLNLDVAKGGPFIKGNDQKVALYSLVSIHPGLNGDMPGDTWDFNPDIAILANSGNPLMVNTEQDLTNFNQDCQIGGCFQIMNWHNYLSAYPVVASMYSTATTNAWTGTANVSGTTVTWVSGFPFTSDIRTITINGTLYRATYVSIGQVTIDTDLGTLPGATFSWNAHAVHDWMLLSGDNLVADNDIFDGTSAISAITISGHHQIGISFGGDALTTAIIMGQGQNVCWNGFDACFEYEGFNTSQYSQNGGIGFRVQGVSGAPNSVLFVGGVPGTGATLGVSGADTNIALNLAGAGAGLVSVKSSALQLTPVAIASLPACAAGTKGAVAFVSDTAGAAAPTFQGAVAAGGTTAVNALVACDSAAWRYQ